MFERPRVGDVVLDVGFHVTSNTGAEVDPRMNPPGKKLLETALSWESSSLRQRKVGTSRPIRASPRRYTFVGQVNVQPGRQHRRLRCFAARVVPRNFLATRVPCQKKRRATNRPAEVAASSRSPRSRYYALKTRIVRVTSSIQ